MSKRLHDTEIWRGQWFRKLSPESKLLWMYLKDNCNCAGVVDVSDFAQIEFFTGVNLSTENLKEIEKQIIPVDSKRFLITDFIDFQYGKLHETHKMRKKVLSELAKFGIKYPIDTVSRNLDTVKDKDKDKDIKKEGSGEKTKTKPFSPPSFDDVKKYFLENQYPESLSKSFYDGYAVADWKDSRGNQIKNWKQKAIQVWFRPESKTKPKIIGQYREI
jgi:hypothetical protein